MSELQGADVCMSQAHPGQAMPRIKMPNGQVDCPACKASRNADGSKNVSTVQDPGEDALRHLLASRGVTVGTKPTGKSISGRDLTGDEGASQTKQYVPEQGRTASAIIPSSVAVYPSLEAIKVAVEGLPLPADLKAYKKILKVKQILEELING